MIRKDLINQRRFFHVRSAAKKSGRFRDGKQRDSALIPVGIQIRHNQAVTSRGVENDIIRFRDIPETKVLSIYHKGPYDNIGETVGGKLILPSSGKKIFTSVGKQFFT